MYRRELAEIARKKFEANARIIAPLAGLPGVNLAGASVKVATQNSRTHMEVMRTLSDRYSPDLLFQIMDLTLEANALGQFTHFPVNELSSIPTPERPFEIEDLKQLREIDISADSRIQGYLTTMRLMAEELPHDVIRGSYITGPFTLAAMIMGAERASIATIREKDILTALCDFTVTVVEKYMELQIEAGAQVLCILEPTGGMLGPGQFKEFSGDYIKGILGRMKDIPANVVLHVCGNTMHIIDQMISTEVDAISLHSREEGVDLAAVAERTPEDVAVIGNINPTEIMLLASPDQVRSAVAELMDTMKRYPNFILSTGCDLPQAVPEENLSAFMETGREPF